MQINKVVVSHPLRQAISIRKVYMVLHFCMICWKGKRKLVFWENWIQYEETGD